MSNVKEFIGIEFPPYHLGVEAGKIKELARAIGDDNPIFQSLEAAKEAGYEGIPIPLTYLQVIDSFGDDATFEEKIGKFGFNPVRILHGEQEYEYVAPIYAGDFLSVTGKVVGAETKNGGSGAMDFVRQEFLYTNQKGELVAICRKTLVHRH